MKVAKREKQVKELTRKEINRRNNIKRLVIAAIAGLIVFIALAVALNSITHKEESKQIYQFIADVEAGTKITESNLDSTLKLIEVQVSLIPEGYTSNKDDFINKYVTKDYKAKDVLTTDCLIDIDNTYREKLKNPVSVSFTAPNLASALAGTIRAGEYVNIYGMKSERVVEQNDDPKVATRETSIIRAKDVYTFKHMLITDVFMGDGTAVKKQPGIIDKASEEEEGSANKTTTMFTTIIEEDDVEQFLEALENCDIRIARLLYDSNTTYEDYINRMNEDVGLQKEGEETEEEEEEVVVPTVSESTVSENNVSENSVDEETAEGATEETGEEAAETTEETTETEEVTEVIEEESSGDEWPRF